MLKTLNSEFQNIQIWFTNQNKEPIEIEDKVYDKNENINRKGYGFLSFARKFGEKYGKKPIETAIKKGIEAAKLLLRVVQKTAEEKIVDKIKSQQSEQSKTQRLNTFARNTHTNKKMSTNY